MQHSRHSLKAKKGRKPGKHANLFENNLRPLDDFKLFSLNISYFRRNKVFDVLWLKCFFPFSVTGLPNIIPEDAPCIPFSVMSSDGCQGGSLKLNFKKLGRIHFFFNTAYLVLRSGLLSLQFIKWEKVTQYYDINASYLHTAARGKGETIRSLAIYQKG